MEIDDVIKALGGPNQAARICDITPNAVTKWRQNGVPALQWRRISKSTGISLEQLAEIPRPDKAA